MTTTREPNVLFFGNPWCSGEIRGKQVAEKGNWLYNSYSMRSGDKVVFVKSYPEREFVDTCLANNIEIFIDVIDCYGIVPFLEDVPKAKVIAISKSGVDYLKSRIDNEVLYVPEHHCNFNNELRNCKKVKRVGFIGYKCNFDLDPKVVSDVLKKFDIEFVMKTEFTTRQEIIDFYKSIDVQLAYRIPGSAFMLVSQLKNPLKLANAGSFGIPTIAYPEISYVDEWEGYFLPIGSMDGMVHWIEKMVNDFEVYKTMSAAALHRARYYHISNVIKIYKETFYGKPDIKYDGSEHSIQLVRQSYPEYLAEKDLQCASAQRSTCMSS